MKEEELKLADELDTWISCLDCGQRVGRDSIHTCLPQLKPLSDEEILHIYNESYRNTLMGIDPLVFAREIEERHGIK